MKKEVKHYIKYKFDERPYVYDGGEIESRDPSCIIKKYGTDEVATKIGMGGRPDCFSLVAFGFYDKYFIYEDDMVYQTGRVNPSWVYFGDRIDISEYNKDEHTIIGSVEGVDSFCLIGGYLYPMNANDITYNEFVENYYQELENLNLKVLRY